ncbi:hypothetical protein [Flavobacterium sp.]|uniref:hypothetical protein n=1 Tax=Flavobacterium sp. TaxID=239 RepID=UPI002602D0E7|nr:hypothetical protein [Flavobacterium sp.]MDD3004729.1 hypothetical protein [Flavobacterium sp.]
METKQYFSKACAAIITFVALIVTSTSNAQCAMCRAVLETEEGGVKAEAVNDGIVYLMAFPYILVGVIGYIVYRSRKNVQN